MKKKIKDLTLEEIIDIANEYNGSCEYCPLYYVDCIKCYEFCEMPREKQILIEQELEQEIEVIEYEKEN